MKVRIATIILLTPLVFNYSSLGVVLNKDKPVYYYVNHETQLDQLKEYLNKVGTVGITGATAMGKSEMAKKYIEKYEDDYNIIAVFDASSNLTEQFIELIKEINHNLCVKEGCNISANPKTAKQNLLNYLKGKKNWLLVFDNVQIKENYKVKDIIDFKHGGICITK